MSQFIQNSESLLWPLPNTAGTLAGHSLRQGITLILLISAALLGNTAALASADELIADVGAPEAVPAVLRRLATPHDPQSKNTKEEENRSDLTALISGCLTPPDYDKTLTPSSTWQTECNDISFASCCIYRMYLYAGRGYNFSLCSNDGVGALCGGDGDLEMFNSSGTSLWSIDGASGCGYDASTLGTDYEDWSPPSNGYYYLKVSEYYDNSTTYCLAYSEDYYIQADAYAENTVEVWFDFPNNPGTVCFSVSPACGSLDPSCDDPSFDSNTGLWCVSTRYNPCEDECGYVTITAEPTNGEDQTKTVHLDDRQHIWCCAETQERQLGVSTHDPNTGECAQASVTVTVIPPEAGTVAPSSGDSYWDPNYQCYVFFSTYTPNCSYSGRARVKFHTSGSDFIYSFEQNTTITPSLNWQTVSDSFCSEGLDFNYYQVYKMYLYAGPGHMYNFSLCENDGVGASCDGDGDLRMFDSSCTLQWEIDGAQSCGYDASTIGTQFESWSPPSDGYYYLKVSEYSDSPMSYSLAYAGGANYDPDLSNGYVDPNCGDTNTDFYWYVHYYDEDGDWPTTKNIDIDGNSYTMTLDSGSDSNGTYRYGPMTLGLGLHDYYFYFTDGKGGTDRIPSSGTYAGPAVSPVITSYPYSEGFESGFADWLNVTDDDFDWTRHIHWTPSDNTGPSSACEGSYYLYTEATGNYNKRATLESPLFDLSPLSNPALKFCYHMFGLGMGTLSVEATDNCTNWNTVWTRSGHQGSTWHEAIVDLSAYSGSLIRIRFNGLIEDDYTSDMAIDDISVDECPLDAPVLLAEPYMTPGLCKCNRISWDPVPDANQYYAECAEDANFSNIIADSGWITDTSYEFCGLNSNQTYWYRVKARRPETCRSDWSNMASSLQWDTPGDLEPDCDVDTDDLGAFVLQWLYKRLSADVVPDQSDRTVNFLDWASFADAWQSTPSLPNWNQKCDIAPEGGDSIVDTNDLAVFMDQWLQLSAYCPEIAAADIATSAGDHIVNFLDWASFANAWQSTPSLPNWNQECDIAPEGGDGIIDTNDLAVFIEQWLQLSASCADIAPDGGDGVINMLDFAVLAENWLAGVE